MDFNWCWKKGISASRFNKILALAPVTINKNFKQPAFLVTNIFDHIEMMPVWAFTKKTLQARHNISRRGPCPVRPQGFALVLPRLQV